MLATFKQYLIISFLLTSNLFASSDISPIKNKIDPYKLRQELIALEKVKTEITFIDTKIPKKEINNNLNNNEDSVSMGMAGLQKNNAFKKDKDQLSDKDWFEFDNAPNFTPTFKRARKRSLPETNKSINE